MKKLLSFLLPLVFIVFSASATGVAIITFFARRGMGIGAPFVDGRYVLIAALALFFGSIWRSRWGKALVIVCGVVALVPAVEHWAHYHRFF